MVCTVSRGLKAVESQFNLIKNQPLYALSIQISVGVSNVCVSFEDLGFSHEEAKEKSEALLKHPPIAVFPKLREYGNKLNTIKKRLQASYMISGSRRWWFVLENRIDDLVREIEQDLLPTCEELKQQILAEYSEAHADYALRVRKGFADKLPKEMKEAVITKYLSFFPSPDDVIENFRIDVDGPLRISSILEDAQVAEKASILSLHKQWRESILNSLQGSLKEAEDEIFGIVAEVLERIEDTPACDLNLQAKRKLEMLLNRLSVLVDFNQSLEEIHQSATQTIVQDLNQKIPKLATEYKYTDGVVGFVPQLSHAKLKRQIKQLRQELKSTLNLSGNGKGHKSLGKWMQI